MGFFPYYFYFFQNLPRIQGGKHCDEDFKLARPKAPVLVSDLHELKGSCPSFGEVSEDEPVRHRQRSPKVWGGKRAFQFVDFRS